MLGSCRGWLLGQAPPSSSPEPALCMNFCLSAPFSTGCSLPGERCRGWSWQPLLRGLVRYSGKILQPGLGKKSGQVARVVLAGLKASWLAVPCIGVEGQASHHIKDRAKGREKAVKCSLCYHNQDMFHAKNSALGKLLIAHTSLEVLTFSPLPCSGTGLLCIESGVHCLSSGSLWLPFHINASHSSICCRTGFLPPANIRLQGGIFVFPEENVCCPGKLCV